MNYVKPMLLPHGGTGVAHGRGPLTGAQKRAVPRAFFCGGRTQHKPQPTECGRRKNRARNASERLTEGATHVCFQPIYHLHFKRRKESICNRLTVTQSQ